MITFSEVITARHVPTLCRLVLVVAIIATPVPTFAQGTDAPPTDLHRYPLPTCEDDWRAVQGVDHTDVWDSVKFVPLSTNGRTSLSLGGEARHVRTLRSWRRRWVGRLRSRRRPSNRSGSTGGT
jgi:hypothetical protein